MSTGRNDDDWIRLLLTTHADRHELDLDALTTRVLSEVRAGERPDSGPAGIPRQRGRGRSRP